MRRPLTLLVIGTCAKALVVLPAWSHAAPETLLATADEVIQ